MEGVFAIVGVFGTLSLLIYYFFTNRTKERLALLEHGKDATSFRHINSISGNLKFGILALAIGLGLLVGYFVGEATSLPEEIAIFSFCLIFGGAGLLLYYMMAKKNEENSDMI